MQFKRLLFICSFVGLVTSTMLPPARSDDPVLPPQNRRKVVLINPVVACNDDGTNPAAFQLPKHAIDQAYAEFGIEFLFLDPVRWNNTQALSVTAEFDQVIRRGLQQRILCRDKHVLNLLFVTSIDNESGPPTSTGDAGTICTIALDQGGDHSSAHSNTQLLVDRVGSCLHLVDPAKTQNSAVNDRIEFLSVQDGRELLVDESWEPYGSKATDNFVRFSIGLDGDAPIPQDKAAREEMIRQRFAEKVLEFSDAEKEKIRDAIARLEELTGHDWPLVSRMPWRFVKVDSSFCSGFPHTRGMTIVMPERGLQRMQVNETAAIALLLHEKLHVIQRLYSSRFDPLFNEYGFERIKLADGELERINIAQNPDAFSIDRGVRFGNDLTSMVMVFAPRPNGKLSIGIEYRGLDSQPDGRVAFGDVIKMDDRFRNWQQSFGSMSGLEHPNETSAYLSARLLQTDYLTPQAEPRDKTPTAVDRIDQTRKAFRAILGVDGT